MQRAALSKPLPAAFWLALAALSLSLAFYAKPLGEALSLEWLVDYPKLWIVPIQSQISAAMHWLIDEASFGLFTLREALRFLSGLMEVPMNLAIEGLATGLLSGTGSRAVEIFPPLSWIAVTVIFAATGHYAKGWALAFVQLACFLYLALFGQWHSAMLTLASIAVTLPFGVAVGLALGIACHTWSGFDRFMRPVLDLMQTVPVFAYLVPILFMFGFGPVSAMIATIIYALPPMIHNTTLALKAVPDELREFGTMVGCTPSQMMRKILLPSALSGLMVGVNQVIMSSLNMVIIASMIGAGGLGYDVLFSLRRLDIGAGMEAGLAIVVLAIALDRLSQALATRHPPARKTTSRAFPLNYPRSFLCVAVIAATWIGGNWIEALQTFPEGWQISTRQYWGELVKAINLNFYDQLEAVKLFFLATLLLPVKGFMLGLPWAWVIGLIALGGYKLGGWRLALLGTMLFGFILLTGQWDYAMISLYLCGVSVLLAILIGAPLGILAAEVKGFSRVMRVAVDTLQTLPTFVYLIPVVMLFNSGDFSALIAVTLYAVVPVIRYTAHGLDQVSPNLIEAGKMIGCSKWQILTKIKLPLAAPHMMLGLSQTIMFALSMLVITALVGTRDLGQQVYTALSQADPGLGLIAGLSVAFIAIVTDRFAAVAAKWLTAGG